MTLINFDDADYLISTAIVRAKRMGSTINSQDDRIFTSFQQIDRHESDGERGEGDYRCMSSLSDGLRGQQRSKPPQLRTGQDFKLLRGVRIGPSLALEYSTATGSCKTGTLVEDSLDAFRSQKQALYGMISKDTRK